MQRVVPEDEVELEDSDHQPLSHKLQRLRPPTSKSQMDHTDFDLSGVDIYLIQFEGVYIEEDSLDVPVIHRDEGKTIVNEMIASQAIQQQTVSMAVTQSVASLSIKGIPSTAATSKKGIPVNANLNLNQRTTSASAGCAPIFSPSFRMDGKSVTVSDSTRNGPPVAHIKDFSGELIDRDNTKDAHLKKLKPNRDQLFKEKENLKIAVSQSEINQKFKENFFPLKTEMAKLRKSNEKHLADM
ncbi:hypothetical protein FRX31_011976, partial [Thalictrum thalictroides]